MNKFLLNRLAVAALVGLAALPVAAQNDSMNPTMPDDAMTNDSMSNQMSNDRMSNDNMMDDRTINERMNSVPGMTTNQRNTMRRDMDGMSNTQRNGVVNRMTGGNMMRAEEMRRIAWYKRRYGNNWRNHYVPGV